MQQPTIFQQMPQKRKLYRTMDLYLKRSIGEISSMEYRRHSIFNEINCMTYDATKTSKNFDCIYGMSMYLSGIRGVNDILAMEIHPVKKKRLLAITRFHNISLYDVTKNGIFEEQIRSQIPLGPEERIRAPNSVHWTSDGLVFTTCSMFSVNSWNSETFQVETIKMPKEVLNHVVSNSSESDQYVAVTGVEGDVYIIDMRSGTIVMTVANFDKEPTKSIQCHLTNNKQYITGNDKGNIHLWDLRFPKHYLLKFSNGNSFSKPTSNTLPIVGLQYYNYGKNVISVDNKGGIKTWDVNTGYMRPNHYESLPLDNMTNDLAFKEYQFSTTQNLKEDVAFMPTSKGLKIIDIDYGTLLPHSNDTNIPLNCATYDENSMSVYAAFKGELKYWLSQVKKLR